MAVTTKFNFLVVKNVYIHTAYVLSILYYKVNYTYIYNKQGNFIEYSAINAIAYDLKAYIVNMKVQANLTLFGVSYGHTSINV